MHLLALQPYDAASHRAFLEGWQHHSRHTLDVLALPGRHFKWRMRQAPIDLAAQIGSIKQAGNAWDALWCTSMLDLAAMRGLSPAAAELPAVVYFHENQLAYPTRYPDQRDIHFGLTNMTTALAAIASHKTGPAKAPPLCVWWNSAYNRDSFLNELARLLEQVPDRPPTLLWAARWEHDKGPDRFFAALDELDRRGTDFRLCVVGQQFGEQPACFSAARERFADRIVRWGYQESRADYASALREADIVVSTADHEFFGLAIAEAVSAGCVPVLPDALAYPEVWAGAAAYHDYTPAGIADAIERTTRQPPPPDLSALAERFAWPFIADRLDDAIESVVSGR